MMALQVLAARSQIMKALPILLVTVLTIGLLSPSASARQKGVPPTAEEIAKKAAEPIVGRVLKVEGTNIVIQTLGKKSTQLTVPTDAKTQFELNDAPATLTRVVPGFEIAVTPQTGIAKKIVIDD